jgi:hypothetical protein
MERTGSIRSRSARSPWARSSRSWCDVSKLPLKPINSHTPVISDHYPKTLAIYGCLADQRR